jgi:hypothetical protein
MRAWASRLLLPKAMRAFGKVFFSPGDVGQILEGGVERDEGRTRGAISAASISRVCFHYVPDLTLTTDPTRSEYLQIVIT